MPATVLTMKTEVKPCGTMQALVVFSHGTALPDEMLTAQALIALELAPETAGRGWKNPLLWQSMDCTSTTRVVQVVATEPIKEEATP